MAKKKRKSFWNGSGVFSAIVGALILGKKMIAKKELDIQYGDNQAPENVTNLTANNTETEKEVTTETKANTESADGTANVAKIKKFFA